jgi:hypothetical protein
MSAVSARSVSRRSRAAPSITSHLPHWSEVSGGDPPPRRPPPAVAAVLRDLVSWAADIAILLTGSCPEDREAIERVRGCADAWLAGEPGPEVSLDDVLTTTATLMAGIDRNLGGTTADEDERQAIGAVVAA